MFCIQSQFFSDFDLANRAEKRCALNEFFVYYECLNYPRLNYTDAINRDRNVNEEEHPTLIKVKFNNTEIELQFNRTTRGDFDAPAGFRDKDFHWGFVKGSVYIYRMIFLNF